MSELLVKNRQVVVPGQVLATGLDYLPGQGAYRLQENIIANRVGLVSIKGRAIKLISLSGVYIPKMDDVIVGKVIDIISFGYRIDTNTAYTAMISSKDMPYSYGGDYRSSQSSLQIGDWVLCGIVKVSSQFLIDATLSGPGLKKLPHGQIMKVNAMKVPRIIGKQGSMISMIKEHTGCQIAVGQNGVVWLRGTSQAEVIAVNTINMICDLAHTSGLTERVKEYLEQHCKGLDFSEFQAILDEERAAQEDDADYEREDQGDSNGGYDRENRGERSFGGRGNMRRSFNNNRRRFGNSNGGNRDRSERKGEY